MTRHPKDAQEQLAESPGLHGASGAIVAGGDVIDSVTQIVEAQQAFVLPPDAYAPIPDEAAAQGVSNIRPVMFVGRVEELRALEAAFADSGEVVVHAVHGLGGVGKSALAVRWASGRHEAVRWRIIADTPAGVDAGVAGLARALQPGLTGLPAELQFERAVQWLAGHRGWLLVLDNVEDPDHIRPLLDRVAGHGRVLVTSRCATGWHQDATTLRLDVLDPADAVHLFTRILAHRGTRDTDGADALCTELGDLALAVEQAAACCAESGTSPRAYLDTLARWPAKMFAATAASGKSARTIARVWRLTLDRIADTPLTGDLLRTLAWYAPDRIPRDLFDSVADPPELAAAIAQLIAYSMVIDNHDGTWTVHRLVQALARTPDPRDPHRLPDDINNARDRAAALLAGAYPADSEDPANWPRYQALLPHTDALTGHHTPDHDTAHTAQALDRSANFRQEQGPPALQDFQRALTTRIRVLGEDHPDTLNSRNNLAGAYYAAGDLDSAVPLLQRTLEDRVRVLGEDHPDTLISRNDLAATYETAGDLERALPLHQRNLEDRIRVLGEDHPDTLISRNNLAAAYKAAGDLGLAVALHQHTLEDRIRVLGEDHPDTLASRNNLAGAYRSAGDLGLALPLYQRNLEDLIRVLGEFHPTTLISRNNLASAYRSAGDLDSAVPLLQRTLEDLVRVLGEDHPTTLASRNNLAGAYEAAGDLERAVPLFQRTLEDRVRVLGEDHPDTLASRNNLAGAYEAAGDLERAVPLFQRNLEDSERVLSPGHPLIAEVRASYERVRPSS
ncbi:FxSxx-COOH system tetratricopeptide repeat protein [Streptomyces erythrochromogenes]|uniref:FxSxx-COOH system tetratricopeptide repeat protein n=1 Tax=Streptomyces erythrochromogenes TaxID=285574 RepID=UPI003683A9BB